MATAWVDPRACSNRGRCAAMAVDTHQVAPKTLASTIIVRDTPDGASGACAFSDGGGGALGTSSRFIGSPISTCSAAHARHAPRQPKASIKTALVGQPTVL